MARENYVFSQVPRADIPRAVFNRNHTHKTTFNAGLLIPFYLDEVLPGDTFNVSASVFARLATPIAPIMDNLYLDAFFFFVPNRLVWENWQKFCGEQENPGDSTDFTIPTIPAPATTGYPVGSLYDYFGIPTGITGFSHSAIPMRGYAKIWNEWFRDQNLQQQDSPNKTSDGPDAPTDYKLLRRGKRHDYFTSCLPWPQKGPGVAMNLGTTAPIMGIAMSRGALESAGAPPNAFETSGAAASDWSGYLYGNVASAVAFETQGSPNVDLQPSIYADLSQATSITINSLREAFQLQKMLERDARGGTRYVELLKAHFGVTSPDARLQRPEFLGGGTVPIHINPVMQTSGTPTDLQTGYAATPQGNLAAYGTASGAFGFTKSFVEHGYVFGLISARADLTYQQGLNRMWSRATREDFYWPALAHLGEQAVLNKEIYCTGTATDAQVFGYQERWAEYRYHPGLITGLFRSQATTPLDYWHLAQHFSALPVLGDSFIQENPPIDRVVAVTTEPQFLMDSFIRCRAARPMPVYSVPGYIDHF